MLERTMNRSSEQGKYGGGCNLDERRGRVQSYRLRGKEGEESYTKVGGPKWMLLLLVDFFFSSFRQGFDQQPRGQAERSVMPGAFRNSFPWSLPSLAAQHSTAHQIKVRLYGKGRVEPIHRNSISIPNKLVQPVLPEGVQGCLHFCQGGRPVDWPRGTLAPRELFFPRSCLPFVPKNTRGPSFLGTSVLEAVATAQQHCHNLPVLYCSSHTGFALSKFPRLTKIRTEMDPKPMHGLPSC